MVQLIKGREPLLEMGLPQIFAQAIALGYQKAQQEQKDKENKEALITRILLQEQLRRERETTKPTKLDYYDPGDILTQARGQYSMYVPLNEYGETVQGLTGAGYKMGTMKQPGLPTLGATRDIKIPHTTQIVQQEYTDQGWQNIGGGPRFKPSETMTPKPKDVLKRLSNISKAKATLEKTDTITAFLATINPDLKGMIGQKISPQDKQLLLQTWNNEINYLNQYVPEKYRMKPFEIEDISFKKIKLTSQEIALLPPGLSQEDAEWNMETYGKTLKEVIDAFNTYKNRKGLK